MHFISRIIHFAVFSQKARELSDRQTYMMQHTRLSGSLAAKKGKRGIPIERYRESQSCISNCMLNLDKEWTFWLSFSKLNFFLKNNINYTLFLVSLGSQHNCIFGSKKNRTKIQWICPS